MNLYVDCEFNGFGGELMSMAIVADDGSEWYEVLPLPATIEPWVAANVVPLLDKQPIDMEAFRASLFAYLRRYDAPTIIVDWYADLVHFFGCFAGRHHAESVAFSCNARLITDVPEYHPEVPHNALSDARAIRDSHLSQPEGTRSEP